MVYTVCIINDGEVMNIITFDSMDKAKDCFKKITGEQFEYREHLKNTVLSESAIWQSEIQ